MKRSKIVKSVILGSMLAVSAMGAQAKTDKTITCDDGIGCTPSQAKVVVPAGKTKSITIQCPQSGEYNASYTVKISGSVGINAADSGVNAVTVTATNPTRVGPASAPGAVTVKDVTCYLEDAQKSGNRKAKK